MWGHIPMEEALAKAYAKDPSLSLGAFAQMYSSWGKYAENTFRRVLLNKDNCEVASVAIYQGAPARQWSRGNVLLIGDAAHPYGPGGQGISMALKDAMGLSKLFDSRGVLDTVNIVTLYQNERLQEATKHGEAAKKRNADHLRPKSRLSVILHSIIMWIVWLYTRGVSMF